MKIVQINATCGIGSTGRICIDISRMLTNNKIENYILYSSNSNGYPLGIKCSNNNYLKLQAVKAKILGNYGFNSYRETRKIICELERIKPDIVHIHNIHGHDCNLKKLFEYFRRKNIKLVWTFHDCWAFTGYCTHFISHNCNKWKVECKNCIQAKKYSWCRDNSRQLYNKKKELFAKLELTIVTPSYWLKEIVEESSLKDYPVIVINNGIDLNVFRPTETSFKKENDIPEQKKIVLGVAFGWNREKGLDVFIRLAQQLNPEEYQIVLVGADKQAINLLSEFSNILAIERIKNQKELAEIYTAATVFVNPTREDTFPTVNMEALACGTPVITFDTGGSPEIIDDTCGIVVKCDNVSELEKAIITVCKSDLYSIENCTNRASLFNKENAYKKYIDLYRNIINE